VDVVGFDVMTHLPSAVFVAAGGYHHHVGFNTWRGPGVPPVPEGVVGLRHFTIVLRDAAELDALRSRAARAGVPVEETAGGPVVWDPSGNALLFAVA
jgi:catechol 2,3-dioxygenase